MRVRGYPDGTPCWAAVATSDLEASRAFYRAMFGWGFADGRFVLDGRAVAGARERGRGPAAWLISISTDNCEQLARSVENASGRVRGAPEAVGDAGTGAVFSDPSGAFFGTWQRGSFGGAQVSMEPGAICWYELATPDLSTADDFYSEVFGWRVLEAESMPGDPYFEFRHNGNAVAGLFPIDHRFPSRETPAHWTVCFMVDDCANACDRAAELGGTVARKPMAVPSGWYARIADPDGAHFAIVELTDELRMAF